ncbi:MAG: TetR/AcrR family transcriptional regulator [Myxococcota bacterium]
MAHLRHGPPPIRHEQAFRRYSHAERATRTARGDRRSPHASTIHVEAALGLVAVHGVDGLTIQRLAKEMGHAVGALYRHFPGKGALIAAMQAEVVRGVEDELEGEVLPEYADCYRVR